MNSASDGLPERMSTFPFLETVVRIALSLPAPLMPKVLDSVIASVRRKDESWPSVWAALFAFSRAPESWDGRSAHGWLLEESDMAVSEVFWRLGRGISWDDEGFLTMIRYVFLSASSCSYIGKCLGDEGKSQRSSVLRLLLCHIGSIMVCIPPVLSPMMV